MVDESQLRRDIEFLSNRLAHRRANTESERVAAEYIRDRFKDFSTSVTLDDFYSIDAFAYLFASYYVEFFMVAVLSAWLPWAAFVYGLVMFVLYMAEFTGTPTMSKLLPQFETQNVSVRFLSAAPRRLLAITANYDSPRATAWTLPNRARWVNLAHRIVVLCMVIVVLSCAAEGLGVLADSGLRFDQWLRWAATAVLVGAALTLYIAENQGTHSRGANNNASGVALLLHLARRFHEEPLASTDVVITATGAKECWFAGMRHMVHGLRGSPMKPYFLNISGVGAGTLRYTAGEGMLHVFRSGKEWLAVARRHAAQFDATPLVYRGIPTDALIPLAKGMECIGIMATGPHNLPVEWNSTGDTPACLDYETLARACEFAETLVRDLDQ